MTEKEKIKTAPVPETKTEAPKAAAYETEYTIEELVNEARAVFGTERFIAKAALKSAGRTTYTEKDAKAIVKKFTEKEVK